MTYNMNYDQDYRSPEGASYPVSTNPRVLRPRKTIEIPSVVKTAATIAVAAGLFFGAEMAAPSNLKPSHFVGTYDARLAEATKAAELQQQAKYEAWAEGVKANYAQNLEQYRATSAAINARYSASYEMAKTMAGAVAQIQTNYVNYRLSKTRAEQATDTSIINLVRLIGRAANAYQAGAGDGALGYANGLSGSLNDELDRAAQNGQTISVEGWDTNIASPAEVQAQLEALKPIPLPPFPSLYATNLQPAH